MACEHDWKFIDHVLGTKNAERGDVCEKCGMERTIFTRINQYGDFGKGQVTYKPKPTTTEVLWAV